MNNNTTYILQTYGQRNLEFDRGEGVYLYTKQNDKYLDFGSGIAVNSLGHCHPILVDVLKKQSEKLWHTSNLYSSTLQEEYAKNICINTFAKKVFFTNSGAEAIECGVKMIRKYFYSKGQNKNRIITFTGSFHGRTITALSAQKNNEYMKGFGPFLDGFDQVPFCDLDALKKSINDNTAALLIETIQGEGGIRPIPLDILKEIRKICDEKKILLFLDEIQCGFGRSGKLFSYQWADIKPDVMAVAKGIASGFPMGACLATDEVSQFMTKGTHGSTFGGNHLAIAVSNAVLDFILQDNFLSKVDEISRYLWEELNKIKNKNDEIVEIRGAGLLLGIKTKNLNTKINELFLSNKLLTICAADNIIRLSPPLIINKDNVDEAIIKIEKSIIDI